MLRLGIRRFLDIVHALLIISVRPFLSCAALEYSICLTEGARDPLPKVPVPHSYEYLPIVPLVS